MKSEKIKGLIAAALTPMNAKGEVDLSLLDGYVKHLETQGLTGVFINGTTGEGLLMTPQERMAIAEAWMPYKDRFKVLVHVGSPCYKTAIELAAHAQSIGADAISAMGPNFLQPTRAEELVAFNKHIAEAAPETPYYYYHIPLSGVNVDMKEFLIQGSQEIPNLCGIKYTSFDTMTMQECIELDGGRFDILHGHDEIIVTGFSLGSTGAIGTSYNATGKHYNKILAAFESGDLKEAVALQSEAVKFIRVMIKRVNAVVGIKAMMDVIGVPLGPVRLPMRNLTLSEMKELEKEMKELGYV